jgi:hypothetical protein
MNTIIPIKTKMDANVLRKAEVIPLIRVSTLWEIEHFRKGNLLSKTKEYNLITAQGLNFMLDVMFHGTSAKGTWYMCLFEDNYTPLDGNTYTSKGFTESTAYDEATRPAFVEAAAASKSITNIANKAQFTINASKTIYGAALVSNSTKGDSTVGDYLFCSSKFSSSKSVVSTDILMVSCTITLADV